MMFGSQFSRVSATTASIAIACVAAAYGVTGGAMFSPGALHAGDSTPARLGGVESHRAMSRTCGACHAALWSSRPMAARCLACHADIQRALTDTSTLHGALTDARACTRCHTEHGGATASLTRVAGFAGAHGQFGFSLDAHEHLDGGKAFTCASCHTASSFKFESSRCESCHREYQSPFVRSHVAEWGTNCQSCHDGRDRFTRGRFSHDSTRYPLTGAHQRAACASCHTNVTTLVGYAKAARDCVTCHEGDDKHRGSFGSDCGSCHTTATWDGATFDHQVFPLDHGEGGRIACKTCHPDTKNYKSYTCYGCHEHSRARVESQHRGEVSARNLDDCIECHSGGRKEGGEDEGGGERRRGRRRGQ